MKLALLYNIFLSILLVIGCNNPEEKTMHEPGEYERAFESTVTKTVGYRYHVYIPPTESGETHLPLLLFLHGAGERGSDLDLVKLHGLTNMLIALDPLPFIVISPQVPEESWWDSEILDALLHHALDTYPVDRRRIYVTGLSMGGFGTWDLITKHPDWFAAAIPICGGGNRLLIHHAKHIPVWAFHGDADPVIPLELSEEMVHALEDAGGNAKLTVYEDTGHDSWTATYRNPEIYEWLLKNTK